MDPIFAISLSGLNAARLRIDVSASNVANADSTGALPDPKTGNAGSPAPYQPLQVSQQPVISGGTIAGVMPRTPSFTAQFSPDSPYANADGLVGAPNVDLATEGINQITALNAYKANLRVLRVADDLDREVIDDLGRPSRGLTA